MCENKPIDPSRIGDVAELERCPSDATCDLLFDDHHHESDPGAPWWSPSHLLPNSDRATANDGMLPAPATNSVPQRFVVTSRSPRMRRSATRKQENSLRQAEERIDTIRQRMATTILVVGLLASVFCLFRGASAPIEQTRAIEDIRPGHKVIVDAPEEALATDVARLNDLGSSWNASDGSLEIDGIADPLRALTDATPAQLQQADYRLVLLQAKEVWEDGTYNEINVQTLQPWQWLHENEVHVGGEAPLPLETVEMNLPVGMTGKVLDILPCPEIERGRGRVVLTTVNRLARGVIELTLRDADGKEETLRPTDEHLFYSVSQGDWLSAGELQVGERLNGTSGPITIAAITPLEGTHRVYNMTVQGEHLYRVAECGVLVHNSCADEMISVFKAPQKLYDASAITSQGLKSKAVGGYFGNRGAFFTTDPKVAHKYAQAYKNGVHEFRIPKSEFDSLVAEGKIVSDTLEKNSIAILPDAFDAVNKSATRRYFDQFSEAFYKTFGAP
ncbi:MAG: hypothetical protein H6822_03885 [Planctomycetaceae bacterium]|nr:hypothetical protein [Planctomycetales bacterium]MCB9921297.1 hypothetical protein [Planctomycetaceae bacterium]